MRQTGDGAGMGGGDGAARSTDSDPLSHAEGRHDPVNTSNMSNTSTATATTPATAIPHDVALQLCDAIRTENRHRWFTPSGMMCRGCVRFSGGDPAKRCFASRPDNRGCYQVNARYDQQVRPVQVR